MNRIYLNIIYACLMTTLFIGCKPHYPEVEYEGDPSKVVFDNIESDVAIQVAINDPLYESYTRGIGAFDQRPGLDSWRDSAAIYVYAFYSPNNIAGPDDYNYSERMSAYNEEKVYCLVDDANNLNIGHGKRARLSTDGTSFLQWYDNDMVYYSRKYPQYRYDFFAYHIDDAADMSKKPDRRRDHVVYDICIDGTQDLMCACAKPTQKQQAALTSIADKYIYNNLGKLAYSTETGHHDLFPIFDMKHQLALVKFFVKADCVTEGDGTKVVNPEVKNIRVRNVIINDIPYQGKFIVAAHDAARLGVSFTSSETTDLYIPVKVKTDADGKVVTDAQGRRITVSREEKGKMVAGDADGFNPVDADGRRLSGIVPEVEEKEMGMGFLLPASDSYKLSVECVHLVDDGNGNQIERIYKDSEYDLVLPDGNTFKAGYKYEVGITVYPQGKIGLSIGDVSWIVGGDISVDGEEGDNNEW